MDPHIHATRRKSGTLCPPLPVTRRERGSGFVVRERRQHRLPAVLIELQSHSTVSDGQLEPAGVVEAAAAAGVTTLALTDHDAVAGVPEATTTAEALGIELVPAVEMSCVHAYADDLHVCGYWVDVVGLAPACRRAQEERVTEPRRSSRTCGAKDSS